MPRKTRSDNAARPMKLDTVPEKVQKEIIDKTKPPDSMTDVGISNWLEETYGIKCSHVSVGRWIRRRQAAITASIYGSKEFKDNTSKLYAQVLTDYFDVLSRLMIVEKELCNSSKVDILKKAKMAPDLFETIRAGVVSAKDLIVGNVGAEKAVVDLEGELDKMQENEMFLQVISEP